MGIMYGTYVKSINELHKIHHAMEMISYYDGVSQKVTAEDTMNNEIGFAPQVFSNFDSVGKCGGIQLKVRSLKECFVEYMHSCEKHFQASFQMVYD